MISQHFGNQERNRKTSERSGADRHRSGTENSVGGGKEQSGRHESGPSLDRCGTEKYYGQLEMPSQVSDLLYGKYSEDYIAESISLLRENSNSLVVDMLLGVSYCCQVIQS